MNKKSIGAVVLAGVLVAGCSNESTQSDQTAKDEVVLSVNGKTLTRAAINADVEAYLKASGDKIPVERLDYHKQMVQNQLVQSFILQSVLAEKAKADGYLVTDADRKAREDEFLKAIAQMPDAPKSVEEYFLKFPLGADRARLEFENGILIDKMLKDLRAKQPPTDYTAKAKEIVDNLTKDNAGAVTKINELKAELDKTPADQLAAKFAELAKANSACPSGQKGGDLGEFTRGQMVPEFDKVAFELPVGKVSGVVKTQFGYHLICVTKKIPAVEAQGENPAEPEKVQASHILIKANEVPKIEEVASFLQSQDERTFTQKFIMDTMKTAKIEAFADDFKQFVPPSEENSEVPVETSTEK